MSMNTDRPVDINLLRFAWPFAAIASILHRVSGAILFVGVGFLLYVTDLALRSPAGFDDAVTAMNGIFGKLVLLGLMAALIYHMVAGIKHLLLDFHIGDSLQGAKRFAQLTVLISIIFVTLAGIWLW